MQAKAENDKKGMVREEEGYNLKYRGPIDMPSDQRLERDQDLVPRS